MAWATSIASADVVETELSTDKQKKMQLTSGAVTKYLFEKTVTKITEYRSMTREAAESAAVSDTYNSDSRTFTNWTPFSITYIGVIVNGAKKTASARRTNDADAWTVTVREVSVTTTEA